MKNQNKLKKAHIVLYAYWFILLIWQNVRSVGNRSGVDTVIKAGLILLLVLYFCSNMQYIKLREAGFAIMLAVFTCFTLFTGSNRTFSLMLYYLYPILLYFIVYIAGWNAQINRKQLLTLLHGVVIMVGYIVVYAVIFCRDQFANAFSISNAYGNELSSFLVSSHEYGMYLAMGIMSIILCSELEDETPLWRKAVYLVSLVVFAANLILTFSRTSIIACSVMIVVYMLTFASKSNRNKLLAVIVVGAVAILFVPVLRNFFVSIVFKNGANSSRNELAELGIRLYSSATPIQKLFGNADFNEVIDRASEHSNLHNGYIQMLLTNGIKGVVFLVGIIGTALVGNQFMKQGSAVERKLCKMFNGFLLASCVFMLTTTSTLFYSSIDSYFLTLFAIIIPKYVRNSIKAGNFD